MPENSFHYLTNQIACVPQKAKLGSRILSVASL